MNYCIRYVAFLLIIYIFPLSASVEFTSSNLPIIIINTNGQKIPYDNPRIVADMGIIYNGIGYRNNLSDSHNNYAGKISIEIRGSSSAGWSKKSYSLETQNSDGSNRNVSLLNMPAENDWILYAPYYDRSFLRNILVYRISNQMGWYAPGTRICELVLNGEYRGVYVLMEKIKRDKNRLNIATLNPDEISGDDVTGGYIIRVDKEPWNDGFYSLYPPFLNATQQVKYQFYYPEADEIVEQQKNYIQNFIHTFENVMASEFYDELLNGYSRYINISSFIDYVLLNEISRNVDGYRLSAFLYKDKNSNGGKLMAGPPWDYNFSFGNVGYYDAWEVGGWQLEYFATNNNFKQNESFLMPFWWIKLFREKEFFNSLSERWTDLRKSVLDTTVIFDFLDTMRDSLFEAQQRNFQIWIKPGDPKTDNDIWFPPDFPVRHLETYDDEVNYLKNWLANRLDWIDNNVDNVTQISSPDESPTFPDFHLRQNYPNPFNPVTTIEFSLPEPAFVFLKIYDVLGRFVETLVAEQLTAGIYKFEWNARDGKSGVYWYKLETENISEVKKLILLK